MSEIPSSIELTKSPVLSNKEILTKPTIIDETETKRELSKISAGVLNIDGNEDGPPIAIRFDTQDGSGTVTILSVADGLGGTGAGRRTTDNKRSFTEAFIAARAAQQAVREYCKKANNPEQTSLVLPPSRVRYFLTSELKKQFDQLSDTKYTRINKNIIKTPFPTTLTTAIIKETPTTTEGTVLLSGDSPFFILTEDKIYTTAQPDDGNGPMKDELYRGHYELDQLFFVAPKNRQLLILTASDGLLKIVNGKIDVLHNLIRQRLVRGKTLDGMIEELKKDYLKYNENFENDDTTLSVGIVGGSDSQPLDEWTKTWSKEPEIVQIPTNDTTYIP